jgi:general secretion pathway protein M
MATPIFERFGLNPREQRLASILTTVFGIMFLLGLPVLMETLIISRHSDNEKTRTALEAVQAARVKVRERQAKKDAIATRYGKRAPALAGFLEQSARAQKLEVTESGDRPEIPIGKRYVERNTVVHLKKAGMLAISKFLEGLEKSDNASSVSRLNIRKRTGEPDSYDIEVGLSAFDRTSEPPPPAGAPGEKRPQ